MQLDQVFSAVVAIVGGVGALVLYFWGSNFLLERLLPDRVNANNEPIESREKLRESIRPWLFVGPAVILLAVFLVYPAIQTFVYSFGDSSGHVQLTRPNYPDIVDDMDVNTSAPLTGPRLLVVQEGIAEAYPAVNDLSAGDLTEFTTVDKLIEYLQQHPQGIDLTETVTAENLAAVQDAVGDAYPALMEITADNLEDYETVQDLIDYGVDESDDVVYPEAVNNLSLEMGDPLTGENFQTLQTELGDAYPAINDLDSGDLTEYALVEDAVLYAMEAADEEPVQEFVLFRNYEWAFDPGNEDFWEAVRNNIFWLLVPFMSTAIGLLIAVLADGVRWGSVIKSLIFLPMAISFIGAGIVWRFVYDFRGADVPQIGILNALVVSLGGDPQPWLNLQPWNNFFLMVILIWIQTGFAMVLLSAALRGVPEETLEAARIDGANEVQIFFRITIPQIMSTILVVLTTITIVVLKVFDIVFAITNGQSGTQVMANLMYNQSFVIQDDGRGAVVSVVLMIAVVPILIWNIRQFQRQEQIR